MGAAVELAIKLLGGLLELPELLFQGLKELLVLIGESCRFFCAFGAFPGRGGLA